PAAAVTATSSRRSSPARAASPRGCRASLDQVRPAAWHIQCLSRGNWSHHMRADMNDTITIRPATPEEVPLVLEFIRDLARYERLEHEVAACETDLREALFGERRYAEVVFACSDGTPVGFALFFHNFSTFRGRPGIYLEDLF